MNSQSPVIPLFRRVIRDTPITRSEINEKGLASINYHPAQTPDADGFHGTKIWGTPVFLHFEEAAKVYNTTENVKHYILEAQLPASKFTNVEADCRTTLYINTPTEHNIATLKI